MNVRAETVNEHISLTHAAGELKRHRKMVEKISLQNALGETRWTRAFIWWERLEIFKKK